MEVVAHQIQDCTEQILPGVLMRKLAVTRMNTGFGWWHGKDEPSFADVHGAEAEDIAEESPVRLGIPAVKEKMCAGDHAGEYIRIAGSSLTYFAGPLKIENGCGEADASPPCRESTASISADSFRRSLPNFEASGGVAQVVRATVS